MTTTWKAPAKLILFGEHSVVYGKHAVAAALSLSTIASAKYVRYPGATSLDVVVHTAGRRRCSGSGADDEEDAKKLKNAIAAIAASIEKKAVGKLEIWIGGNVPEGAGLGSSAALSVAVAAAVNDVLKGFVSVQPEIWRTTINNAALEGERIFHDNPSGVDNTVSSHGGALLFAKGTAPKHFSLSSKEGGRSIRVLIVDTGVPRSTKDAILAVRGRLEADKGRIEGAFERMDAIALEAFDILQARPVNVSALDALVDENHKLLRDVLGVGHPALDKAVSLCAASGIHAKISGAGCGGCVFGFIKDSFPSRDLSDLISKLTAEGMRPYVVDLGASGVCEVPTEPPPSS